MPDDPSGSDLPPSPPGYEPISDPEYGFDMSDEASLDFAFSAEEVEEEGNAECRVEAPSEDRAGYGRLPSIKIIDDTVIQSARRLGIGALILLGGVALIVALMLLAVFFLSRAAPSVIPEEGPAGSPVDKINLVDGQYVMSPELMLIGSDRCIFVGPLITGGAAEASSDDLVTVTLTGSTLAECGTDVAGKQGEYPPTAERISFQVVGGKALILRLDSPVPTTSGDEQ